MSHPPVWLSKGHFDEEDPICTWGMEGRSAQGFPVPTPQSFVICYDLDRLPVFLWRVGTLTRTAPIFDDGMTWFAESEMSELVESSAGHRTGIEFHDLAIQILPPAGGWMGAPVELNEDGIDELFGWLGWDRSVLS